jgi:hypothetical protein
MIDKDSFFPLSQWPVLDDQWGLLGFPTGNTITEKTKELPALHPSKSINLLYTFLPITLKGKHQYEIDCSLRALAYAGITHAAPFRFTAQGKHSTIVFQDFQHRRRTKSVHKARLQH